MTIDTQQLRDALQARQDDAVQLLREIIALDSVRGKEAAVAEALCQRLEPVTDQCEPVAIPDALIDDPEYSFELPDWNYRDRPNIRLARRGAGGGRSLIINTHMDVVPPSPGQESPFEGRLVDGTVYGRGACDCKGQIAMLYLCLQAMADLRLQSRGDLIAHLVVEEECGGNGTLAAIRGPDRADAALVLEPTDLNILPSVRGAVWFSVTCHGRAGHSGQAGRTVSALKEAIRAIEILEGYHGRLLAASKGHPLYDRFENPMPITFGTMEAGDWPAMAPNRATFKGVLGFLPNKTRDQIQREMRDALESEGGDWLPEHFDMEFMYRHDCNEVPVDHPLVQVLEASCGDSGHPPEVTAMPASCDAWFYTNLLQIPTAVFGAGTLGVAHSSQEHIPVEEIVRGAEILTRTITSWCG